MFLNSLARIYRTTNPDNLAAATAPVSATTRAVFNRSLLSLEAVSAFCDRVQV